MPARDSRLIVIRRRVPRRATCRRLQRHVRELDDSSGRSGHDSRSWADWPALHPDGRARRCPPPGGRWTHGRRVTTSHGHAARRDARHRPRHAGRRRADEGGRPDGAELVCDATGASAAIDLALRLVRPNGQVTKVGWSPETYAPDLNPLVLKNVRLQGSFSHNYPIWERVIELLSEGLTMPEEIVGLRAPLAQWRDAFEAMHDRRVINLCCCQDQQSICGNHDRRRLCEAVARRPVTSRRPPLPSTGRIRSRRRRRC